MSRDRVSGQRSSTSVGAIFDKRSALRGLCSGRGGIQAGMKRLRETWEEHSVPVELRRGRATLYRRMADDILADLDECMDLFGGQFSVEAHYGYGEGPKTEEEFIERYRGLTNALLDNPDHFAFCYTQLTDVEQEQNGLYTYDRKPKFDPAIIRAINARKAAMEEE